MTDSPSVAVFYASLGCPGRPALTHEVQRERPNRQAEQDHDQARKNPEPDEHHGTEAESRRHETEKDAEPHLERGACGRPRAP
jgi:hypothetical protein